VSDMTKILALTVTAAMFFTAVAPKSQTAVIGGVAFKGWNSILKTLTGQPN